ncbi:MAG: nitroreductase [Proteobacteria bacterium]|nr:nitroreductase [Pseudomonadota bacterium]HQR03342.1 nitroreductase [Rhodocyclaceae bacterium]
MDDPFDTVVAPAVIDAVIRSRRSVRAFLPAPVAEDLVREILSVACRAPSGTNTQPWRCHVLAGERKDALSRAVIAAHDAGGTGHVAEYDYYPGDFPEPFLARRRKVGWDMYGLIGIAKGDHMAMHAQHGRNYRFFDAPVGMIFTIDRRLRIGSWLDYGMFLGNITLAARARGLHTCAQAAFAQYHEVIRTVLGIPAGEMVVCGMALGYANPDAAINRLVTERAPVSDFARFEGFGA